MIVQLVSYRYDNGWKFSNEDQVNMTAEIINSSRTDLILFCGKSLRHIDDTRSLQRRITNKSVSAVLDGRRPDGYAQLVVLQDGKLKKLKTPQMFAASSQLDIELSEDYLDVLEKERFLNVGGKRCLIIQCGENNILKNHTNDGGRVSFRYEDDEELNKRFTSIINKTDIFLNPIHSPMGNQGKMARRREYLTRSSGKYYLSTSTNGWNERCHYSMQAKILQYATGTPTPKETDEPIFERLYTIRTFEIK